MIAIGDLHGDYYKLKRILEEYKVARIEEVCNDVNVEILDNERILVFIGDYIDWRGEEIENPLSLKYDSLVKGSYFIIKLISKLIEKRGNVFALIGNHEHMMLNALRLANKVPINELQEMIDNYLDDYYLFMRKFLENNLLDDFLSFVSWYSQGGANTLKAFDNKIDKLLEIVKNEVLFKNLLLFVYFEVENLGKIVFSHSFPDNLEVIDRIINNGVLVEDINFIIWSRKIWGIDAFKGRRTKPFSEEELIKVFEKNNIDKYVIGHTKVSDKPFPFEFLGGRIINVDNHGIPFSKPLVLDVKIKAQELCHFAKYWQDSLLK